MVKRRLTRWITAGAILAMLAGAAQAGMVHRYSFSGDATDSIGGANGTPIGDNAVISATHLDLTLNAGEGSANPGIGGYVDLPNGIVSAAASNTVLGELVIELWTQADDNRNWAEVFSAGTSNDGEDTANSGSNTDYITMIPQNGANGLIRWTSHAPGVGEGLVDYDAPLSTSVEQHLVGVLADGNISLYVDGEFIGTAPQAVGFDVTNFADNNNWLGRSQWNDPLFDGTVNEFRIYDAALTPREIYESFLSGPDNPGSVTITPITNVDITGDKPNIFVQENVQLSVLLDSANVTDFELLTDPLLTWSSDDEEIITVTQEGMVVGVRPGTATITANFDGVIDTVAITVDEVPDVLEMRHRYSFNSAASEELLPGVEQDLVGTADGTTWGAQYLGDGTMELNPSAVEPGFIPDQGYVDLPNGIVSALNNGTFEAWFTPTSGGGNWQRVWDLGTSSEGEKDETLLNDDLNNYSGLDYLMLTRKVGADNIFQYEMNPPGGRPTMIIRSPVFQEDQPYHVVATYDSFGRSMALYVNGIEVGRLETDGTLLSQIDDVNNWLGRSNWGGDAFGYVNMDEFRMWEGILPPLQIAINSVTGPDNEVTDPGTLLNLGLTGPTDTLYAESPDTLQLVASADFTNVSGVPLNSVPEATFSSDNEAVATVSANGLVLPVAAGTAVITLDYEGIQDTFTVTILAVDKPITTLHRWSFNETSGTLVSDSVGGANGNVIGVGGTFGGGELTLAGGPNSGTTPVDIAAYVDLPNGMISALPNAVSMEIWTTWNDAGLPFWQRIFSFGVSALGEDQTNNGSSFANMIVRPNRNNFSLECGYELLGQGNTPLLFGGTPIVPGVQNHIVVTWDFDLDFARMYLNGELVRTVFVNDDRTWADLAGLDVNNWFGRSQWTGDGMYNGSFNEIRIHAGIMNQADVTASMIAGPDMEGPTEVPLGIALDAGSLKLSWPSSSAGAAQSTTDLDTPTWNPVAGTPVENNGTKELIVTPAQDFEAFRLGQP